MKAGLALAGIVLLAIPAPSQVSADVTSVRGRADDGDVEAQNQLGNLYSNGAPGLKVDFAEALKWFKQAADKGYAPAQYNLGLSYELGRSVKADERQAFKYFLMAAEQGFGPAQFNVGNMYTEGRGIGQDYFEANLWYKQAADSGMAEAQFNLGLAYEMARGMKKDDGQAARWYKQAADRGYPPAQHNLGLLTEDGRGVAKDPVAAAVLYRAAAEQNFAPAQVNYGLMVSEGGPGVAKDPVQGLAWLNRAVQNGAKSQARDALASRLTADQIAAASRISSGRSVPQAEVRPVVASAGGNTPAAAGGSADLVSQLRAQSVRLAGQIETLTAEKEATDRQNTILAAQVKDAQQELTKSHGASASTLVPAPSLDVSGFTAKITMLTKQLEQAAASLKQTQEMNAQLTTANQKLVQDKAAPDAGNSAAPAGQSAVVGNLQRDNARLNDEVKRATRELLSLNTQLRAVQRESMKPAVGGVRDENAGQLSELTTRVQQGAAEAVRLSAENRRLIARVGELEQGVPKPAADKALVQAQQSVTELKQQLATLQAEKDEFEKRARSLEGNLSQQATATKMAETKSSDTQQKITLLQNQLADREQASETQRQTAAKLARDNKELGSRVEDAEAQLKTAATRKTDVAEVEKTNRQLNDRLKQAQSDLAAQGKNLAALQLGAARQTGENKDLGERLAATEARLKAAEGRKLDRPELDSLRKQVADGQTQVDSAEQRNKSLTDQLATAAVESKAAQAKLAQVTQEFESSRASTTRDTSEAIRLKTELSNLTQKTDELSATVAELTKSRDELQGKLADARSGFADAEVVRTSLFQTKAQVADLQRELAVARQQSAGANSGTEALKQQLAEANQALDKSSGSVAELTASNEQLEKSLAAAKRGATDSGAQRDELARARRDLVELATLRDENIRLRKDSGSADDLKAKNEKLVRDNAELTEFMNANRGDLNKAQTRVAELEKQLDDTLTVRTAGSDAARKLQGDLDDANRTVDKLTGTVAELTVANEKLEKDVDNAEKSTAAALAAQSQAVSAASPDAFQMEISTLNSRVKQLEGQVEEERSNAAKEITTLAGQLQKTRETNKSLTDANRALLSAKDSDTSATRDDLDRLQSKAKDLATANDILRRQGQEQSDNLRAMAAERDSLQSQLVDARKVATVLPGLSDEKAALQERLETVGTQMVQLQRDQDDLQKANADLTQQLASSRQNAEKAQSDIAAVQGKAAEAEKAAESHNASVAELTAANDKLEREHEDMRRLVDSYRNDITRLTQNVRNAEQQRTDAERGGQQNVDALAAQMAQLRRDLDTARTGQARLSENFAAQDRDRTTTISQLRTENGALAARLNQAQGTLDQIASAARLGTPAATLAAGGPASARPAAPITTVSTAAAPEVRYHTVGEGDSLSRISLRYYGTANRWQDIYQANRDVLQGSNALRVGQQLRIP